MNDFSNLNHLSPDIKQLIVNGQTLVDQARDTMKDRNCDFDLTSRLQLKNDCKEIEKYIKLLSKGKAKEKDVKHLENVIIRLRTVYEGLIDFYSR